MIKRVKRKPKNSRDWRCFVNRVRYITDQDHPHHKIKKVVQAAGNFFCLWGQTANGFIESVHKAIECWKLRCLKKRGSGNPTEDVFFELVFSAPKWLKTTAKERAAIDKMITAPFRDCPIRRGWHLAAWDLQEGERPEDWKPIDDAHYLISARDNYGKATISTRFGHGRETLESWMRRMDEEICDLLNLSRENKVEPVRPIYLRNLGEKLGVELKKLHEMIAHHTSEPVARENLAEVIEEMERPAAKESAKSVPVAKVTNKDRSLADDKLVWVHFTGREKPNKYRIKKLLFEIAETQLDIELSRPEGNEGEAGGAGGESGGGTGGLGGVASAAAQPGSPASTHAPSRPASPEARSMVSRSDPLPTVSESASAPLDAATPVKHDPTQSAQKSAEVKPGPTLAAPGPVPALPGSMLPSSASSVRVPATDEPVKPKNTSLPPAHVARPMRQTGPIPASPSREKSRRRPKPQHKGPTSPGMS
jgi:hypothetical protein